MAGLNLDAVWSAIQTKRSGAVSPPEVDLATPEWLLFCQPTTAPQSNDFRLASAGVPAAFASTISDVVRAERLREVVALIGFTRIDGPDSGVAGDLGPVTPAPITRGKPTWVPANEVRGEGIFVRLPEDRMRAWIDRTDAGERLGQLEDAHQQWRVRRNLDPSAGWPGARFVLLHSLAHVVLNELALECGYSAASVRERIYAREGDQPGGPMAGLLWYTAAPDAEGTLGGLVALADPANFGRILTQALERARLCSGDPHCAEHTPVRSVESLHNAACHACLFVPETSCVAGNRYLDRATLVDTLADVDIAYFR